MKILLCCLVLLVGCDSINNSKQFEPEPVKITIVSIYGNDDIDATIEYTVTGQFEKTYLTIDGEMISVTKSEESFIGIFPNKSIMREIIVMNGTKRMTMQF